jgi:hypothetical protein
MKLPGFGQSPAEKDRAYIAELARGAEGDLTTALRLGLSGLDPERQVAMLGHVVDALPPILRAAIWSEAGVGGEGWQRLRDTMTAEARRPLLVAALVERGREAHEVDLGKVPAGVRVVMSVAERRGVVPELNEFLARPPANRRELHFTALGSAAFAVEDNFDVWRSVHERDLISFVPEDTVTLGSLEAQGGSTTILRYGRRLATTVGEEAIPYTLPSWHGNPHGGHHLLPAFVGAVTLDGQPAFAEPRR